MTENVYILIRKWVVHLDACEKNIWCLWKQKIGTGRSVRQVVFSLIDVFSVTVWDEVLPLLLLKENANCHLYYYACQLSHFQLQQRFCNFKTFRISHANSSLCCSLTNNNWSWFTLRPKAGAVHLCRMCLCISMWSL